MNLSRYSLYICNVDDFRFLEDFDGNFLTCGRMDSEFDFAKGAFSKIFGDYIVADGPCFL